MSEMAQLELENLGSTDGGMTIRVLELPCEVEPEEALHLWIYGDGSGDCEIEFSASGEGIVLSAENQFKLAQALLKSCKMAKGGTSQDG